MQKTDIHWTDYSSNPLKYRHKSNGVVVWSCVKVSAGCARCYSEALALRFHKGKLFNAANMEELEPFLDEKELRSMLTNKAASGKRCFVADMTDLFGEWVPDEMLDRMFAVFALRQNVTWQVLTKRAERMRKYCCDDPIRRGWLVGKAADAFGGLPTSNGYFGPTSEWRWPLPNVHLGVSIENQKYADLRREPFRQCPATVKFVSYEPALGQVDWTGWEFVNQVISGGESGKGARPCHLEWHRQARDFCAAHGIAYFCKQLGSHVLAANDEVAEWFDDCGYLQLGPTEQCQGALGRVFGFRDRKAGDMQEFPSDLRIRQFPDAVAANVGGNP